MRETLNIIFVGEPEVGKSTVIYALANEGRLNENIRTIGVDFKEKMLALDANRQIKLHLWDTAGCMKYHAICEAYYKSAKICCIVINASDPTSEQIRKIIEYKNNFIKENNSAQILVLANHKQEQNSNAPLTAQELEEAGITPSQYLYVSAYDVADNILSGQQTTLEKKLVELVERVADPNQIFPIPIEVIATRTSRFSFNCLRILSLSKCNTDDNQFITTLNAIKQLNNKQAATALDIIHLYLKDGALHNKNKPYHLGFFGFSGTRRGSFKNTNITSAITPEREIHFESKAIYSENGMVWLSMTMPFSSDCLASNMLTLQEIAELDSKLVLTNLYNDVVVYTNNLWESSIIRHPTTLQFYKKLPRIIEKAIGIASELDLSPLRDKDSPASLKQNPATAMSI